mmetsp:Transcript_7003/g.8097  ORF Transcript_7003/g.8097 Transcript_7003/m.8097 type:complete len:98 (-) Transcript_7003:346-639(-)
MFGIDTFVIFIIATEFLSWIFCLWRCHIPYFCFVGSTESWVLNNEGQAIESHPCFVTSTLFFRGSYESWTFQSGGGRKRRGGNELASKQGGPRPSAP